MAALGAGTPSRTKRGWLWLTLASPLLLASCVPADPVGPKSDPGTLRGNANLVSGPPGHFFVSPTGSPSGDGSFGNPWDLTTALDGPAAVTPGSTIWLRGGTYADGPYFGHGYLSNLTGAPDAPIVVRQLPGERATVTKFLVVRGAYTWYWGFEVVHPAPHIGSAFGVDLAGPGSKLINLVVHDASVSGIFIRPEASDAEVYGAIAYNNGRTDRFDHGIYCRSQTSLLVQENIVFDNWSYGIHCFVRDEGPFVQNITLRGNVAFNNYAWGEPAADILVGGHIGASGTTIDENYTYRTNFTNTMTAEVGHGPFPNQDLVLTNNYFVGGWWYMGDWTTATVRGNTLYNFTSGGMVWNIGDLSDHRWSDNTFFGDSTARAWRYDSSAVTTFDAWRALTGFTDPGTYAGGAPTGVKTVVRPNQYEPGRANIIVYNWDQQSAVSVNVSGILQVGDHYVVQHAQDFYGSPVTCGVYTGGPLRLPMVSITPPPPLGVETAEPAPVTGPTFNVFVLMKGRPGRCAPGEAGGPRRFGARR